MLSPPLPVPVGSPPVYRARQRQLGFSGYNGKDGSQQTLYHESWNQSMEDGRIVFAGLCERQEVVTRPRRLVAIQLNVHVAKVGLQLDIAFIFLLSQPTLSARYDG